jgi:DNA anti-recombination protein RmuC
MPENREENNGVKLHLQEAEELKKQWFSYVFSSLQRLSDKLDELSKQVSTNKDDAFKQLSLNREEIIKMLSDCKDELKRIIELKEDSIYDELGGIEKKIGHVRDEIRDCTSKDLKDHIDDSVTKFKDINDEVRVLSDSNIKINTKLGVYIVLISAIVTTSISAAIGGFFILFKEFIKSYLGIK